MCADVGGASDVWTHCPLPERHRPSVKELLPASPHVPGRAITRLSASDFLDAMGVTVVTPTDNLLDKSPRAVSSRAKVLTIDVRSPKEYETGHVPGAVNVPLFSNEQRHEVGKVYATEGKHTAIDVAMRLVTPELGKFAAYCTERRVDEVMVYCWRGGMRSASVAWLLCAHGFRTTLLAGGYKAFRRYVVRSICERPKPPAPDLSAPLAREAVDPAELGEILGPHRGPKLYKHAWELHQKNEFSRALSAFEEAARVLKEEGTTQGRMPWNLHVYIGECLLQFGEDVAALAAFDAADAAFESRRDPRLLRGRALAYYRQHMAKEAKEQLIVAAEVCPGWTLGKRMLEALEAREEGEEGGGEAAAEGEADAWDLTFGSGVGEKLPQEPAEPMEHPSVIVLSGPTGSGKTDILHELRSLGEQVLDLEGLAHHRASAFGSVGMPPQPTSEMFENLVMICWRSFDTARPVWIEHEDTHIGGCSTPYKILELLDVASAGFVLVDMPRELRAQRLVADYCGKAVDDTRAQQLIASIESLGKRWGQKRVKDAVAQINAGDFSQVASDALMYYDRLYTKHSEEAAEKAANLLRLTLDSPDHVHNAAVILKAHRQQLQPKIQPSGGGYVN
eukprot:TRINITY_DN10422_c0_g1_i2.p1 TRINITY_DN10422_c0_g1~~TRINITY_DN10422_c0_g1_i2.p1  ORF type:complete len:620 (-),score=169.09 TRINITY_DN10422_c0_g1_i2:114-1973(-)